MKHLLLSLLAISVSLSCVAEDDATQLAVYDTENHKLTSDGSYYVLPAEHETTGGLSKSHPWRACNSFVIQAQREADVGLPLRFTPLNDDTSGMILLSTNISVQFDMITQCAEPMYWHVTKFPPMSSSSSSSSSEPRLHVAVGKDERAQFPDPLTSEFVFRIERYESNGTTKGYKLVSCVGKGPCKDLGLHVYEERTWLAISDSPFVVVFKKGHRYA
ncbi:unnamed protein product [Urochloa humidicola]